MNVEINDQTACLLKDVPEDEQLVVFEGKLCMKYHDDKEICLCSIYGEIFPETNKKTKVSRIKSITVEI